jgi:hypothetical protein
VGSYRSSAGVLFAPAAGKRLSTTSYELLQSFGVNPDAAPKANDDAIGKNVFADQIVNALRLLIESLAGVLD